MRQTSPLRSTLPAVPALGRFARDIGRGLIGGALLALTVVVLPAHAASNTNISWVNPPSPATANIVVGDTVTWQGSFSNHPLRTTDSTFSAAGTTLTGNVAAGQNYVQTFSTPGTYFFICDVHSSMHTTVVVSCPVPPVATAVLDIDANGVVEANTDGLLVLRYMLGLRGSALTLGAVGTCQNRTDNAIQTYLSTKVVP